MKRQTLVNGLLSLTVVSVMTGCVDDKYDLSDIDTTSRFTVDNLTVPVNLSEIKLKNVINLDDNDLIEKVTIDGKECYAIKRGGDIAPTEFNIGSVEVAAPNIAPSSLIIDLSGLPFPPGVTVPELNHALDLHESEMQPYDFKMENVDKALKLLSGVKTENDITINVELTVPSQLLGGSNKIAFQNLQLQLPWGLTTEYKESGSNEITYVKSTGLLTVPELAVNSNGKANLTIKASGLELGSKGKVENCQLAVTGEVGIKGGSLALNVKNVTLPASLDITAKYIVSGFKIASFSGDIDYNMDDIHIAPISLNDLPDFLDSPETNLIIANPQILVSLNNPVGKWLEGKGRIILTSNFKNNEKVSYPSDVFSLVGNSSNLAFSTDKDGYAFVKFDGLKNVLTNGNGGLPSSIEVNIDDLNFAGTVTDFPLGNLGSAEGSYEFNAPLGFGDGSVVIYETTEDGWSSKDLDKVNIKKIHLNAVCNTDLPVSVQLSVVPVDKKGNVIAVDENSGKFNVPAHSSNHPVELLIKAIGDGTIKDFDGVKFRAIVKQDNANNTEALGPDLQIMLNDIRVTVDGYYETDF